MTQIPHNARVLTNANHESRDTLPIESFAPLSRGARPRVRRQALEPTRGGVARHRQTVSMAAATALTYSNLVVGTAAAVGCTAIASGSETTRRTTTPSEGGRGVHPEQAAALDLGLTASIKLQHLFDREVSGRRINVDTRDCVVVLRGRVDTEAERVRATTIARETQGVAWVVDQLTIRASNDI
jgi:BON domain